MYTYKDKNLRRCTVDGVLVIDEYQVERDFEALANLESPMESSQKRDGTSVAFDFTGFKLHSGSSKTTLKVECQITILPKDDNFMTV